MEITYIYGVYLHIQKRACRPPCRTRALPTASAPYRCRPLHSQSTKIVGIFHKWRRSHKTKSCLVRLLSNTSLFFLPKNHFFTLFSRRKFLFSLLQTKKINPERPTTLQQPWTNWFAPTMWTLVKVKTDLDDFLGPKSLSTTWT